MAGVGPVPCFQQHRVKHSSLHYFTGDSVDLHPIAESDSVLAHQDKPSDKSNDEILQRNREAGRCKPEISRQLSRRSEYHQQRKQNGEHLQRNPRDRPQRLYLPPVQLQRAQQFFQP